MFILLKQAGRQEFPYLRYKHPSLKKPDKHVMFAEFFEELCQFRLGVNIAFRISNAVNFINKLLYRFSSKWV